MINKLCTRCKKNPAQIFRKTLKSGLQIQKYHYCVSCKREYANNWAKNNKEKVRQQGIRTRIKHKESIKIKQKEHRWKLKLEVLSCYSNGKIECACCKINQPEFLAIDHINNNGAEAKRNGEPKGGIGFYTYLKKKNYPKGFQVLCHNCNMAKAFYGKCPHNN